MNKDDLQKIVNALEEAYRHLEYCGWGDNWERECAYHSKLPEEIEEAIKIGNASLEMLK